MEKAWHIQTQDSVLVSALQRHTGLPGVVAQLLVARGITEPSLAHSFLDVKMTGLRDPEDLPGLPPAANFIFQAVQAKRRIIIYGDYDADGMTSTAILYRCLNLIGGNVGYYIPNRMDEGYGLNCGALKKLSDRGAELVISVDCGIASVKEADFAKEIGLELIVTDHHEMGDRLPDATAIVHPRLPGFSYPFAGLCGAGVAFKLAWALCQRSSDSTRVSPRCREFLLSALSLAAIGTIADVVPLIDENRILVKHGLRCLHQKPFVGLEILMKVTGLNKASEIKSEDVGFVLGPRLNASGRLGQAQLGVELLTTDDPDRAQSLAEYINELNTNRGSLERSILKEANQQIKEQFDPANEPALVLSGRGWHKGVIGIVAGRLAEKHHRPVVVIALDELGGQLGVGSARSVPGVDLFRALGQCRSHLVAHGGHAAAAGLRIDEPHIDQFRASFCENIAEQFSQERRVAELHIDTEVSLPSMNMKTVLQIESLAPFGEANPRPVFCCSRVVAADPKAMGSGDRHLSLTVEQHGVPLRAIAFNQPGWIKQLSMNDGEIDIAFRPIINEFRGRRTVELQMVDWRRTKASSAATA